MIDLSPYRNKKTALVCSGGVVRAAAWHLGVALALDDLGFSFLSNKRDDENQPGHLISTYVGSSAGAMVALFLASGYGPQDIINATLRTDNAPFKAFSYKDMFSLRRPKTEITSKIGFTPFEVFPKILQQLLSPLARVSGLFSTVGIAEYLRKNVIISERFEDYLADIFIVGTQLDHSRKVIFSKFNYPSPAHDPNSEFYTGVSVVDAACASMAVPPFYSPHPIYNPIKKQTEYYIDGEIRETLSTHVAVDHGCELIISSWTHTPYHYQEEVGSLVQYGIPAICLQSIYLIIQKKIQAARQRSEVAIEMMDVLNGYLKREGISDKIRNGAMEIIERKLQVKRNIKFIDIYPGHRNYQMFFSNSFSLDPQLLSSIVKFGYKRTFKILKEQL